MDTYLTIAAPTIAETKEKGSRFIAYAYFVQSEEAVKERVDILRKEHFKATHHCYAYRLGTEGKQYRANDDGEPSGTAGRPILGQIDSFGLTNVLIVVVRYYGGTKLGTSGLIAAYKESAKEALQISEIEEKIVESTLEIRFAYTLLSDVMQFLKAQVISVINTEYSDIDILLTISVRNSLLENVKTKMEVWKIN
jgi:uncharacterized YigZ family protein